MFRITQYMREILTPSAVPARRPKRDGVPRPVVIWNLLRRCNLLCKHCYSFSADHDFPGELALVDLYRVMEDMREFGVPALILSGGEPLLHPDIFPLSRRAKELGFSVALSSNGALIDEAKAEAIAEIGYDYVGVSLDGIGATHDRFRGKEGAFAASLAGIRACRARGIKVGLRYTMTQDNEAELPQLIDLLDNEDLDKFYLSHLNYSGRGLRNRRDDSTLAATRSAVEYLFERSLDFLLEGRPKEFVTGNNDADAVAFLLWLRCRFPEREPAIRAKLEAWGGNSAGIHVANIDNEGNVYPDTFWKHHRLGSVKERPFSAIWSDVSDPLLSGLREYPRRVGGRCGQCAYLRVCNGNTRVRAFQLDGDPWAEDPGCYLEDDEIGGVSCG